MKANLNYLNAVRGMMRNLFLGIAVAGVTAMSSCSKEESLTTTNGTDVAAAGSANASARNAATNPVTPIVAANGARPAAQVNADQQTGDDSRAQTSQLNADQQQFIIGNQWRLIVGFESLGAGIDARAFNNLQNYVELVQNRIGKQIVYQSAYTGREGEVELRFHLREFEGESQIAFVADVKELMRNHRTVKVYENAVRIPE